MDNFQQRASAYAVGVEALRVALTKGDESAFWSTIDELKASREYRVMTDVRQVADDLRTALEHFQSDSRLVDMARHEVPDARNRLAHVLKLTDSAAHHTMDLVDQCCPVVDAIARDAERLLALSVQNPDSERALHMDTKTFLSATPLHMKSVRGWLSEVLLAQGYQDLSGQILRSVMKLVDELEVALGNLVRIDSLFQCSLPQPDGVSPAGVHGPVVPGVEHGNTVDGQQDVDAMLSNLGM